MYTLVQNVKLDFIVPDGKLGNPLCLITSHSWCRVGFTRHIPYIKVCKFIHSLYSRCSKLSLNPGVFLPSQFMGRWFEIAKLPAQFERGRCIETNFTLTTSNSIRVVSSEILWVLCAVYLCKQGDVCMACGCFSLTWNLCLSGINQKRRGEENWRDRGRRGHEESSQAGNKLFLRWATSGDSSGNKWLCCGLFRGINW